MEFRTRVSAPQLFPPITFRRPILFLGSCFASRMGRFFENHFLETCVNPFGVLYNPGSIAEALVRIMEGTPVKREELLTVGELHTHLHFHGSFSQPDPEDALVLMNEAIGRAKISLQHASHLILTWGSARIYFHRARGVIAANCHRIPAKEFDRIFLTPDRIVQETERVLERIWSLRPDLQVVLTVSPVRYLKEGAVQNTKSKATLLLAALELAERHEQLHYFPSFEMMMDDLRDYRFYEADLIHPSAVAHEYIQDEIREKWLDGETHALLQTLASIRNDLEHRPHHPLSKGYGQFLGQLMRKIDGLWKDYPTLQLGEAMRQCEERLENIKNAGVS